MVMLPHNLNQMSRWIWSDTGVSKPARSSSRARAVMRAVDSPEGSPMMILLPKPWRTTPGAATEQLACTTLPTMCRAPTAAAMSPPGSTACSCRPVNGPPKPCRNHHGTPFMAVITTVCAASSGPSCSATSRMAGAFTAITTRSCGPSSVVLALARMRWVWVCCASFAPVSRRRPSRCSAASVWPRASIDTSQPARARPAPSQPPMAPAPTMQTFLNRSFTSGPGWSITAGNRCRCGRPAAPARRTGPGPRRGRG